MEKLNKFFKNKNIYVGDSQVHGKGVFTEVDILPGEIIEQAYVIHPENKNSDSTDKNFQRYFFAWPYLKDNWKEDVNKNGFLTLDQVTFATCVLGFGMIYNHSLNPNVLFDVDVDNSMVEFRAKRKILAGEELFICYNEQLKFDGQHGKDNNATS